MYSTLFPWGDLPITTNGILLLIVLSNVITGIIVVLVDFDSSFSDDGFGRKEARGMMLVTFFFFALNYVFMGTKIQTRNITRPKVENEFRVVDVVPTEETIEYIGARTMGNFLEQQVAFIVPFWVYGALINYRLAEILGAIWVGIRYMYPLFWGYFGTFNITVEISTQMNYAIIHFFCLEFLFQGFGVELTREVGNEPYFPGILLVSFVFVWFGIFLNGIGTLNTTTIVSGRGRYKTKLAAYNGNEVESTTVVSS